MTHPKESVIETMNESEKRVQPENEDLKVEWFKAADAPKIPPLFREVYGEEYPFRMVYESERILSAYESGEYFPFVVHAGNDRIAAYGALYRSAPFKGIVEFGQGAVSPSFRKGGLGRKLFEFAEISAPTLPGAEIYFGEAVCNHTTTQKAGALIKTVETGIEVDLLPGEMYGISLHRVAAVDMFRTFVPKPHTVYIPSVYEKILRFIYEGFDDIRTIKLSDSGKMPEGNSKLVLQRFDNVRVARLFCEHAGSDFESALGAEESSLSDAEIRVIQIWLNLSDPAVEETVTILRRRGFFFGGLFPRWFDADGMMMQKISGEPDWEGIILYSERSEKIVELIRSDWERIAG